MSSFSFSVRSICVGVIVILMIYTIYLVRSSRLNEHVTVRWILAEIIAIFMILLWGMLPLISFTSTLSDRELLLVLAVIFFGFMAFLILDSHVHISQHTQQIKMLTQELALLRENTYTCPDVKLPQNNIRESDSNSQNVSNK